MVKTTEIIDDFTSVITLPSVYLKVKEILSTPNSSMADLANVIVYDPGMSVRMLKVVNSAYFAQPKTIETVSRAINILGTQQVHDIILATCLSRSFEKLSPSIIDMETFWMDSVLSALLANELAKHCDLYDKEKLFVIGLLRDIGHLLFYQQCPELAQQVYIEKTSREKQEETILSLPSLENELVGTDFAKLGHALMEKWKLPESIYMPIKDQLTPDHTGQYAIESSILNLVWALVESKDTETAMEWMQQKSHLLLDINQEELEAIYNIAKDNQLSVYNLFFAENDMHAAA